MNTARSIGIRKTMRVAAVACALLPLPAHSQDAELATKSGNEVGVTFSGYKYTEPGLLTLKANKIGIDYSGTYAFGSEWPNRSEGWFVRGDVRFATGKVDYSSSLSGSINNRPDRYYELRGFVGKDFHFANYTLSPYAGLGYRNLYNDLRGVTSTGARGYRRESNYLTLPIGVAHRMNLANQRQLLTTLEFDYLIRGRQDSSLSDATPATADVSNTQRNGFGLRLGAMVRFPTWSVGPFLNLWRIKDSDRTGAGLIFEPRNNTYEFGVKAAYAF